MADSAGAGGWELTESDPGLFSSLLWDLGVKGVQVEELISLDSAVIEHLKPLYAFIFLFKWRDASSEAPMAGSFSTPNQPHYFALQTITNACATLALLNATLNIPESNPDPSAPPIELGEELSNLQAFSAELDPEMRGAVLTNSDRLREVHNSFARSNPFALDEFSQAQEKEDAYHFIAYMRIHGHLYELDGLKPEPVDHGAVPASSDEWLDRARQVVEARIATYAASEVNFNLMAITADQQARLEMAISAQQAIASSSVEVAKDDAERRLAQLQSDLADERDKRERWAFENAIRRHNQVGLIHAVLLELAQAGKLGERIEAAKALAKDRKDKRAAAAKKLGS